MREGTDVPPDEQRVLGLVTADLTSVAGRDARDAFEAIRSGMTVARQVSDGLRDRLPEFLDRLAANDAGLTAYEKRLRLFSLTMFAVGALIPALAAVRRYLDAVGVARAHTR